MMSIESYRMHLINIEKTQQHEEVSSLDINAPAPIPRLTISGPASGHHLHPFALPDTAERTIQLWHYLQRSNVVLFFHHGVDCPACTTMLQELAAQRDTYSQEETAVLAVGPNQPTENLQLADRLEHPFPLLSNPQNKPSLSRDLILPRLSLLIAGAKSGLAGLIIGCRPVRISCNGCCSSRHNARNAQ